MSQVLRLLALDPSITAFGWCVLEFDPLTGNWRLLAAGVLETQPLTAAKRKAQHVSVTEDDARRVRFLRRSLVALFQRYTPAVVAIESHFGSQNAKAAKLLGAAQSLTTCVVDQCMNDARGVYVAPSLVDQSLAIAPVQRTARPKGEKGKKPAPRKRKQILADINQASESRDWGLVEELERELEALKAANRRAQQTRDARKLAIAEAVVERFGVRAWLKALECDRVDDTADEARARVMHHRYEGAHDAAGIALAALDHPVVAALRSMSAPPRTATQEPGMSKSTEHGSLFDEPGVVYPP